MDKKLYHRGNGEVVKINWSKPVRKKFSQSEAEMQMWEQELQEEIKNWNVHIASLPIYAYCDPDPKINPVGWIEGEEVYQTLAPVPPDGDLEWVNDKNGYEEFKNCHGVTRIWVEPKN